ncbi:MAG: WD40 repeat domain-containing protein [Anaerolineales bacterium]
MKSKTIPPLLLLSMLVFLSINCGTLDMSLVEKKTPQPGETAIRTQRNMPAEGQTEIAPSGANDPTETAVSVPTQAASIQIHAEPKTTLEYTGWHIAWTPDGKWLILGEREVHFLDAQTLQETRSIQADRWVEGMAVSPDSQVLAMIDESRGVMLFDIATGSERLTIPNTDTSTSATSGSFLAFSPDSATLAVIIGEVVKLYQVSDGEELNTFIPKSGNQSSFFSASAVAFSKDGGSLFVGGSGIAVINVADGTQARTFGEDTRCMALSPDGALLVTAGTFNNQPVAIWETATGRQLRTLSEPANKNVDLGVSSMAFSPDGRALATASADATIKLWDVATGALLQTLVGHTTAVAALAFSPDGTTLASGTKEEGDQAGVRLWTVSNGPAQPTPTRSTAKVERPTSIPLSARAILPENAQSVKKLSMLQVSESGSLAWSPDGKWLVDAGRKLHFLDGATYKEVRSADFQMEGLAVSPDGRILAAVGYPGVVLFDLASGSELRTLPGTGAHTTAVSSGYLAFTPDSATLAVVVGDVVKLFDVASGGETGTIVANGAFIIAISPDGKNLYTGGWSGEITIWDLATGEQVGSLGDQSRGANRMALSPDGSMLASAGTFTEPIILWETATGHQLHNLSGLTDSVTCMVFSPDGRILATSIGDVTIVLWDTATGEMLKSLVGHTQSAESIVFSPDGATLASSSYNDGVYLWGLPAG